MRQRAIQTYYEVHQERERAHAKHAPNSMETRPWDDPEWLPILVEEVGEVARALCEREPRERLREELLQVAAVACAWADSTDGCDAWFDRLLRVGAQVLADEGHQ